MQGTVNFSVVVPVFITKDEQLPMTLQVLKAARDCATVPYELVIVETLTEHLKDIADVYVHQDARPVSRSTSAINDGIKAANGDFIVLLSNDVFVEKGWIKAMKQCFELAPNCGAATLGAVEHKNRRLPIIREYNYWPVAMLSRKCISKVGMYDEEIWGVWNDTDYFFRMHEVGLKMYQNCSVMCNHLISKTEWTDPHFEQLYQRNRQVFYRKHVQSEHKVLFSQLLTGTYNYTQAERDKQGVRINEAT